MDSSKVLCDYIVERYGSVDDFAKESGIPSIDLSAVLLKDHVSAEICIGINLCEKLNIDIEEFVFNSQIKELKEAKETKRAQVSPKAKKSDETAAKNEIYSKCMRLSELEKLRVLDYIDGILKEKGGKNIS